jgi:YbbR domain-containing protein
MRFLARTWAILVHNFWWRLLALVIAVAIWAVVASEPELSTFVTVPLEYRNLPDDLEMSSPPAETATLELRGPAGELRGFNDGRPPSVVLDMSNITPGVHRFSIDSGDVRLASGVRLMRAIPSEVRFEFDRRLMRTVPVRARFTGEGRGGYVVAGSQVEPRDLVIVGPAQHVERIASALTDPIDVSSTVGASQFHVHAFVDDPYVRIQSSPEVTVTVSMKRS